MGIYTLFSLADAWLCRCFQIKTSAAFSHWVCCQDTGVVKTILTQSQSGKGKEINTIIIGYVDSGKCTTIGHLVYKCGVIIKQTTKSLKRRLLKWEKVPSSMPVAWTNIKLKVSVLSLHSCRNFRPANAVRLLLMFQDTDF